MRNLLIICLGVAGAIFIISYRDYLRRIGSFNSKWNLVTSLLIGGVMSIIIVEVVEPSKLLMLGLSFFLITFLYYNVGKQNV